MLCLSVDIPCDLRAPARGRRAVDSLSTDVAPVVLADVKLLVSELITNSVKYVDEQGHGPVARDRPMTDVGGWGLHLVQTLSDRWGVHEGSTHVWFEIRRDDAAARRDDAEPAAA